MPKNRKINLSNPYTKRLIERMLGLIDRPAWEVFSDFVLMASIAISNRVDPVRFQHREKLYMSTWEKYNENPAQEQFPYMFDELVRAFDYSFQKGEYRDILGDVLIFLNADDKRVGQYLSGGSHGALMSRILECTPLKSGEEFQTLMEPTCGSGGLICSFIADMAGRGIDFRRQLCVTACDRDYRAVAMTYIQLSLYGVPAVVIQADSLLQRENERWYTPVYLLDNWLFRCRCGLTTSDYWHDEMLKRGHNPMLGVIREMDEKDQMPRIWLTGSEKGA